MITTKFSALRDRDMIVRHSDSASEQSSSVLLSFLIILPYYAELL